MTAVVFIGPTISSDDARAELRSDLDLLCLGPAAQGDVYRAALERPAAIGIIDGYFDRVPAIWHKEILWAMSEGIPVFGGASMGALRAAELEVFGMVGVGAVFEAYRDGILEDDDEVAVAHAAAEFGFRAGSEAMVDIRATLAKACADGVIGECTARKLVDAAKSLFYPQRTFSAVLESVTGVDAAELERLREWLPAGRVNQKRQDAAAVIRAIDQFLASGMETQPVTYHFEETNYWVEMIRRAEAETRLGPDATVLNELRRDPVKLEQVSEGAFAWLLSARQARRDRERVFAARIIERSAAFCRRHGLADERDVEAWLRRCHTSRPQLNRILEASAFVTQGVEWNGVALEPVLLDYLRWTGDYGLLLDRARERNPLD
ncbi:MAG TPA: hypothetical protein DEH78_03570 [Solibacterales bacterium]|nr:hypothetical protein [Bryobacterales bacterium]